MKHTQTYTIKIYALDKLFNFPTDCLTLIFAEFIPYIAQSNGNIMMMSSNENIFRWPANSTHKDQWRRALIISLICAWANGSVNNLNAGDLRRHRDNYDVIVMCLVIVMCPKTQNACTFAVGIDQCHLLSTTGDAVFSRKTETLEYAEMLLLCFVRCQYWPFFSTIVKMWRQGILNMKISIFRQISSGHCNS